MDTKRFPVDLIPARIGHKLRNMRTFTIKQYDFFFGVSTAGVFYYAELGFNDGVGETRQVCTSSFLLVYNVCCVCGFVVNTTNRPHQHLCNSTLAL